MNSSPVPLYDMFRQLDGATLRTEKRKALCALIVLSFEFEVDEWDHSRDSWLPLTTLFGKENAEEVVDWLGQTGFKIKMKSFGPTDEFLLWVAK
jgi:hypothetical protein